MTTPQPRPASGPDGRGPAASDIDWDAEEEGHDTWRARPDGGRARRTWWVVGTVAVVVMSAVAVWFGFAAAHGRVQWVNTGHEIASDTRVEVRFDLRRDPSRSVTCELEAQDLRHSVVGRTEVTVGPASQSPSRHIEAVQTAARAVTGYVDQCWYADEAPPSER